MKKGLFVTAILLLTLAFGAPALAVDVSELNPTLDQNEFEGSVILSLNNPQMAFVDGKSIASDVSAVSLDGRTLVPVRFVAAHFDATVTWVPKTQRVTLVADGRTTVELRVGSKQMTINGKVEELDVAPQVIRDSVYLPLRVIGEIFDKDVSYDQANRIVFLTDPVSASESSADGNLAHRRWVQAALAAAFAGEEILYADTEVMIWNRDGALWGWDFAQEEPVDLAGEFDGQWVSAEEDQYLVFRLGDDTAFTDVVFEMDADGNVEKLFEAQIADAKYYNNSIYYLADNYEFFLLEGYDSMQNYEGNLYRISISQAKQAVTEEERAVLPERLGKEGYLFGVVPQIGPSVDGEDVLVLGAASETYDWSIEPDGIEAVGCDFTSVQADETVGRYRIDFDGSQRLVERIDWNAGTPQEDVPVVE